MRSGIIVPICALIILCSSMMTIGYQGAVGKELDDRTRHSGDTIDAPYSKNDVTIDGVIGASEWTDANFILVPILSDTVTVFYKFNDTDLLIAFVHDDDQNKLLIDICLDPENDGTTAPGTDDLKLHTSLSESERVGDGDYWIASTQSNWSSKGGTTDIVEFGIALSKLGITPGEAKTVGISFVIRDVGMNLGAWPSGAISDDPSTWADIHSSNLWEDNTNLEPTLGNGGVTPDEDLTTGTFEYSVIYTDGDNDPPGMARVVIDGTPHVMSSTATSYDGGALFTYTTSLPAGDHQFYFLFNDSRAEARFPSSGHLDGPNVITPNAPPELVPGGIPSDLFSFPEDSEGGGDLIDLEEFFTDDRDDGNLIFEVTYQEDPYLISAAVDGHYLDVYQLKENWFGSLEFQVKAVDRGIEGYSPELHRLEALSNLFSIEITPENDAPTIVMIEDIEVMDGEMVTFPGSQGAREDEWFNISVTVQDPDMTNGDAISYSLSGGRLAITRDEEDTTRALISFLPTDVDVGHLHATLTASDLEGASDSIEIEIEITNTNDEPYITHIVKGGEITPVLEDVVDLTGDKRAKQGEWFNLTVFAHDDDVEAGLGDALLYGIENAPDSLLLDPITGDISFLPTQEDVGPHTIQIWVSDGTADGQDRKITLLLDVEDVNDAPNVPEITSETGIFSFFQGTQKNLTALSVDIDPDDVLTFEWYSDVDGLMGIGATMSLVNLSVGMHNITVTVVDSEGATSTTTRAVSISARPGLNDPIPGEDEEVRVIWLILGLFIAAIVLSMMVLFAYGRIKRKNALDHINRKRIYEIVKEDPGVHFSAISDMLGLKQGVMSHHLNVLEKGEYIRSLQDGKFRRFYLFDESTDFKIALTAIQQRILSVIMEEPGISQTGISN
ncbi:MAG: winged helix-turn-helix transcriptional regulator, partial [Thermoplasmata archaeon]|nr:winged helix-turn-helix transcriptional regulator [Thermoplasmata archaeon]